MKNKLPFLSLNQQNLRFKRQLWVLGSEGRGVWGLPHAPPAGKLLWQQPVVGWTVGPFVLGAPSVSQKKNPLRSRARIWCGFYKPAWRSVYVFSILCRVCKATLVYQAKSSQTSAQPSPCHRGREKGSNEIPVTMPFRFPALGAGRILLRRPFRCGL